MYIINLVKTISNLLQRKAGYVFQTSVSMSNGFNTAVVFFCPILILDGTKQREVHFELGLFL